MTTTPQHHWLAAGGAAVLLACAGASAQQTQAPLQQRQPLAGAASTAQAANPSATRSPDAKRPPKRDAPGTAKLSGYNPVFSPEGQYFVQQDGARLYQAICQGCHMPQGQGARGAGFYPALANNPRLAAAAYPNYVVLSGLHGMPGFAERLTDQQVANVVNYVRTHFGNNYTDATTPEEVNGQRPAGER